MAVETVACYGEDFVDYLLTGLTDLPSWGTSTPISTLTRHPGGNAVNRAIGISKLGLASSLPVVKIGHDAEAAFIKQGLLDGRIPANAVEIAVIVDKATALIHPFPHAAGLLIICRIFIRKYPPLFLIFTQSLRCRCCRAK